MKRYYDMIGMNRTTSIVDKSIISIPLSGRNLLHQAASSKAESVTILRPCQFRSLDMCQHNLELLLNLGVVIMVKHQLVGKLRSKVR
jgi:hypothetical protein